MKRLLAIAVLVLVGMGLYAQTTDVTQNRYGSQVKDVINSNNDVIDNNASAVDSLRAGTIGGSSEVTTLRDSLIVLETNQGTLRDSVIINATQLQDSLFHSRTSTDSDSIDLADKGGKIYMNHSDTDTITLRTNAAVHFPLETEITIIQWGTGQTNIEAEGGVTINSADGALNLRVQYSAATLIKKDTDVWLLIGDIE